MVDNPNTVALAPSVPEEETVSLAPTTPPLSDDIATKRAYKIISSDKLPNKTYDEVYASLTNGEETNLRDEATANETQRQMERYKNDLIVLAKNNPQLSPDMIKAIQPDFIGPDTIVEKGYADGLVNELDKASERRDSFWRQAQLSMPAYVAQTKKETADVIAKREVALTMRENVQNTIQNMGFWDTVGNFVPTMFQPYMEYNLRGLTPDVGFFKGGLATNLDEARKDLFREPTVEAFTARLKSIVEPLKEQNPYLADKFLESVIGTSTDAKSLDNIFTALTAFDYASAGKLGWGLLKGARRAAMRAEVNSAAKDIIEAATKGEPTVVNRVAATGDIGEAASTEGAAKAVRKFKGSEDNFFKEAMDTFPGGLKEQAADVKANPGRLANNLLNIIEENFHTAHTNLLETMSNLSKIRRIPLEQASKEVLDAFRGEVKNMYPGLKNAILEIGDPFYAPLTNTYHYDMFIGNHGGVLFTNPEIAKNFAKVNGLDAAVNKQGLGYYLTVRKPLNETSEIMRDLLITPKGTTKKEGLTSYLSWLRNPDDTVSFNERVHRKIASYAQGEMRKLEDGERKYLQRLKNATLDDAARQDYNPLSRAVINTVNYIGSKLPGSRAKDKWDDLARTLKHNQDMPDPNSEEKLRGYFFRNVNELQNHYLTNFKRLPDFDEVQAYFAHKRLWELDHSIRNTRLYTNKSRLGTENHTVWTRDADGNRQDFPSFDGIRRSELPGGEDLVLVIGDRMGEERIYRADMLDTNLRNRLKAQISEGKTSRTGRIGTNIKAGQNNVFEVYAPEERPFEGYGKVKGERIRYVVAKNVDSKNISFNQLPRRGGGHFEYDYDFFMKQANMRVEKIQEVVRHWYEGDKTVFGVKIRATGKDLEKKMNEARIALLKGDEDLAKALVEKNLPFEWDEFRGWFHAPEGKRSLLDLAEPFVLVAKDKRIKDIDKSLERRYPKTFKDGTREGSLARTYQVKFTGERDAENLQAVKDVGTRGNPIYKVTNADLVDPIPMMNRSLGRVTNSTFMDDYKIAAMERWIRDAAKYLDHDDAELRYSPFYYFQNYKFKGDVPLEIKSSLAANNFKIRQFVGLPNYVDMAIHQTVQNLNDAIYRSFGGWEGEGQKVKRGLALTPSWLLSRITDPISFVRGMVFHMKLGLFAVPQILVQNMTYVTIAALSPTNVIQGTSGAMLHWWGAVNPKMLPTLDRYATKLGWRPGEWLEANREMIKTGFGHVGGEYINLDNLSNFKVVKNAGQDMLDWGQWFFRSGEKNVRYGAWYTAFKEYRRANPLGRITPAERDKILERADTLYTNMSRASASALHTGPLSLTTQFLSYQLRLAELFFSKRIGDTATERAMARARIVLAYSAMYGLPSATGVTGVPIADYLRKEAIKAGYVIGDNALADIAINGLPSYFMAWINGGGDAKKGEQFNFGSRYGAPGFEPIKEMLKDDVPWYKLVGGAAGSVLSNMYESMDPMFRWIGSVVRNDPAEQRFPLRATDVLAPLNEAYVPNTTRRLMQTYNTGRYLSKKGTDYGEASMTKAFFMAGTGMQPQSVDDAYLKIDIEKDQKEAFAHAEKQFIDRLRKSLIARQDKNDSAAEDYYRQAFATLVREGYPEEQYMNLIGKARESLGSMMKDVDYRFYLKNVPETRKIGPFTVDQNNKDTRLNAYQRQLELEKLRGQ